jgi:hypothetical protein
VSVREVAPLILLASAIAALPVRAQPAADEAGKHFDRGAALAAEQKFEEAAREFRASYELKPRKESLFAWAQVLRLGGDCPGAVELYRKFLRSPELNATQIEAAQLSIDRCEAAPAPRPAPPPPVVTAPPPAPVAAVATTAPPPVGEARRSRGAVVLGATLLGGAVLALGASGTFLYLSRSDERAALAAGTWQEYYQPASRSRTRQRWAFGLMGGGVLLAGGAVVEWLATAPRKGTMATAWLGAGTVGVGLRGSY